MGRLQWTARAAGNYQEPVLLYDASAPTSRLRLARDVVMGGRSQGELTEEVVEGRPATRLRGEVSLENGGGFIQMTLDARVDARPYGHLRLELWGNGETYDARLKTTELSRPWQSYRQSFLAPPRWTTTTLSLDAFEANRTELPFDRRRLRRLGLLAIGRVFTADLAVSRIELV